MLLFIIYAYHVMGNRNRLYLFKLGKKIRKIPMIGSFRVAFVAAK